MVVDDLANRRHACDILLDQNLGRSAQDYIGLVSDDCCLFIGPSHALVRNEFSILRESSLNRRNVFSLQNILITMGGVDQLNVTGQVLDALAGCTLPKNCSITIVMGENAPWLREVQLLAADLPWSASVVVNTKNMGNLMFNADLCIGAAGSTSWERCTLGLPTILLCVASNQKEVAHALSVVGAALIIDMIDSGICSVELNNKIREVSLLSSAMVQKSGSITDGSGAKKIARFLVDKQ
tara:strand:- start:171 stop:887 length:717 start_codon:yes stop_codon:yes gene_type:complete